MYLVYTYCYADGKPCKGKTGCNSYVKLYINGEEVLTTPQATNKISYDIDQTFTTSRISKDSTVKIEVWNAYSGQFWGADTLLLSTEGNIESFLKEPLREGEKVCKDFNSIETMSFWQDEFK